MSVSAFAPGKLILMGEHAVVYGHPAVAMAVNRGTRVTLSSSSGPTALEQSPVSDPRLLQAIHSVLPEHGISVHIESNLPIGRGMGSSAALAVALARSAMLWEKVPATDEAINKRAFAIERIFHGNPSGVDHTVSMRGGVVQYQKGTNGPTFQGIDMPELPIVVIDSGTAGNTAQMVEHVKARLNSVRTYIEQIGALVTDSMPAMQRGDKPAVGQAWHENHLLLRALGVSTPALDEIVRLAFDTGAYGAKMAGAGGGGVVIALTDDPIPLIAKAKANRWTAFQIFLHT